MRSRSSLGAFALLAAVFGVAACGLSVIGTGAASETSTTDGAAGDLNDGAMGMTPGADLDGAIPAQEGGGAPLDSGTDSGPVVCNVSDASFGTDPTNCGACGHDCMGGTCVTGQCQPVDLGAALETSAQGLFVDSTNVYFTDTGSGGTVKQCSVAGCAGKPTVLGMNLASPNAVIAAGGNVYWTNFGDYTLDKCAVGGCSLAPSNFTSVTSSGNSFGRLATDGTTLFFTDGGNGIVRSCPLAGCGAGPTVIATTQQNPWGIVVDATNVYWVNDVAAGTVVSCPKTGCGAANSLLVTLAIAQDTARTIAIDATTVYWVTQGGGTVMSCAKAGCAQKPTTLTSGQMTPQGIAVDDTWVYFTEVAGNNVKKVAKTGGAVVTLAKGQASPFNVAVDDKWVYWTNNATSGSLRRVAK